MASRRDFSRTIMASALALGMLAPSAGQACTSLLYIDGKGASYAGRTLELSMELPYKVAYFPTGTVFGSTADQHHVLDFSAKNAFVSVGVADPVNGQIKVLEGINTQGLSFSLLAFPSTDGPADAIKKTTAVLAAIDLGTWTLSQFDTVAQVKAALEKQPVLVTAILPDDALKTPFHYALHDATGASIVIEFSGGQQHVYDNPVGVMTNGPTFPWHMTNLGNYTFMDNKDQSEMTIRGQVFRQPDSGIATAGLSASNTSVGRFVRAVYYSRFAERVDDPDMALKTLAHVMNNFDRPRGITVDARVSQSMAGIPIPGVAGQPNYTSEYTSWTTLMDLNRKQMHIRTYDDLNYVRLDLTELAQSKTIRTIDLQSIAGGAPNASTALLAAR